MDIVFAVTEGVTADTFVQAAAEGRVRVYRARSNGTTRHIPFLPEGSDARAVAEWIRDQKDSRTMKDLAAEMHESVPTVRRRLVALEVTEEVEGYDQEDIEAILADALEVATASDEAASASSPTEPVSAVSAEPAASEPEVLPATEAEFVEMAKAILG